MTPTEQDNELLENIADLFDELCEPTNKFWHRDSGLFWAGKVMQLITADRKRVELETRVQELGAAVTALEQAGSSTRFVITIHEMKDRIAELKAQQEEV